jgi:hypothetical protein
MPDAHNVSSRGSQSAPRSSVLLAELDRALAETNAPVRSGGPNLLTLSGLIIKEIFNLNPRRPSSEPPTSGESSMPR